MIKIILIILIIGFSILLYVSRKQEKLSAKRRRDVVEKIKNRRRG